MFLRRRPIGPLSFAALVLPLVLGGCNAIGPAAIHTGRADYNEAIWTTNSQQIFTLMVRNRFDESAGLLAVSTVNASFSVTGSINANFGIGNLANYAGNLVPLSTGAAYEESPTITYTPVAGRDYLEEVFAHLPLDAVLLMIQASDDAGNAMITMLKSINGVRNPAFLTEETPEPDPRFARVAELMSDLQRAERITWASDGKQAYLYASPGDNAQYLAMLRELEQLLDLKAAKTGGDAYRVPIELGIGTPDDRRIIVETRSLADLYRIGGAAMEVPQDQVAEGLAPHKDPLGLVGRLIAIRSSDTEPSDALVASRIYGNWYYISKKDVLSKQYFRLMERLTTARIADAARERESKPILTLPVVR